MNKYAEFSKAQPRWQGRRCVTKHRYATQVQAIGAASKIETPMRAYHCGLCLGWHLTSQVRAAA